MKAQAALALAALEALAVLEGAMLALVVEG
jgi:hypothetical protein